MIGGSLALACGEDRFARYPAVVVDGVWVSMLDRGKYVLHPTRWQAIVDTGAGTSAIPSNICRELRIPDPRAWDYLPVHTLDRQPDAPRRPHYFVKLHVAGMKEVKLRVVERRPIERDPGTRLPR